MYNVERNETHLNIVLIDDHNIMLYIHFAEQYRLYFVNKL